jgi:hypothetical protein
LIHGVLFEYFLFGVGLYLDKMQQQYDHQIIVAPNKSTDYLYAKIDLLSSKIAESDSVFLNSIGYLNMLRLLKSK